jgi:hypothetical protein
MAEHYTTKNPRRETGRFAVMYTKQRKAAHEWIVVAWSLRSGTGRTCEQKSDKAGKLVIGETSGVCEHSPEQFRAHSFLGEKSTFSLSWCVP